MGAYRFSIDGKLFGGKRIFSAFHKVAGLENGWNLILVNQDIYISDDHDIELTVLSNSERVDSRIYPDLQDMFDNARKDGGYPVVGAGFRTHEKQQAIFEQKIEVYRAEGYSKAEDIYEHLKSEFENYSLRIVFVLPDNYHNSAAAACLNEMRVAKNVNLVLMN